MRLLASARSSSSLFIYFHVSLSIYYISIPSAGLIVSLCITLMNIDCFECDFIATFHQYELNKIYKALHIPDEM